MAYRQLFFVACVCVGVGLAGCGGESASSAVDPATNDSAPSNPDAPPSGADDSPPSSDDEAPSSADTPPGSTDSPGGSGDLQELCRDVCRFVEELSECVADQDIDTMGLDEVCSSGCDVQEPTAPIPCRQEITAMFDCILGLGSLCPENGGEAQAAMCQDEAERFTECAEEEGEPVDVPGPGGSCTLEDSCQGCDDQCDACRCASPNAPEQCDVICDQ